MLDRGLAVNPNLALGWRCRGWASVLLGDHQNAVEQLALALRLSPLDTTKSHDRTWNGSCPPAPRNPSGSFSIMPKAWLKAMCANETVGAISKNSALGRSFIRSVVTISAAPYEVFELFLGPAGIPRGPSARACLAELEPWSAPTSSRNHSPTLSQRRRARHIRRPEFVEDRDSSFGPSVIEIRQRREQ